MTWKHPLRGFRLRWPKNQDDGSLVAELREAGLVPKKSGCSCGCHDGSVKHAGPCRCQRPKVPRNDGPEEAT